MLICCLGAEDVKQNDFDILLKQVVKLDFSRICSRLQLSQKRNIRSSCAMELYRAANDPKTEGFDEFQDIQSQIGEFFNTYQALKQHRKNLPELQIYQHLEKLIKIAQNVDQFPSLGALLEHSKTLCPEKRITVRDWVAKLGHYFNACYALVLAARRKRNLFQKVQVESFEIPIPKTVHSPSAPGSAAPLLEGLRDVPEIAGALQRFRDSQAKIGSVLLRRLDGTRASIKVHAEIKLLFYYETHRVKLKPRIICANKSACFLCGLFLRVHGQFQVPMTFGKLNERWILPDWLSIQPEELSVLRLVVAQFDRALDEQIQRLAKGAKRLPDPMESAIGLPARWSPASSVQIATANGLNRVTQSLSRRGLDVDQDQDPRPSSDLKESFRTSTSNGNADVQDRGSNPLYQLASKYRPSYRDRALL